MISFLVIFLLVILGALAGPRTLLHTFAVAFDVFFQNLGYDSVTGITLSSRAGLAARNGHDRWAKFIGWLFRSSTHCEDAIKADIERAKAALVILQGS